MLITNAQLILSFIDITSQYLSNDSLTYIILVIYLKIDQWEKFNFNLDYILSKALDPDNQDNMLYKTSYQKLIDILWDNNFSISNSKDKL